MQPIMIQIKRRTLVPTKRAIKHQWRTDWPTIETISYEESQRVFKVLGGEIETEAQFAKVIYENFGKGEYLCIAIRKGISGMWNFLRLVVDENGFRRVEKGMSEEEKQIRNDIVDYKRLVVRYKEAENQEEQDYFAKEMGTYEELLEMNELFGTKVKKKRKGPMNYLKSTLPVYKAHEYENYEHEEKERYNPMNEIW